MGILGHRRRLENAAAIGFYVERAVTLKMMVLLLACCRRRMQTVFGGRFDEQFERHLQHLGKCARERREFMILKSVVYGGPLQGDSGSGSRACFRFRGCERLDRLRGLLCKIDAGGFERSDHQLTFHSAFERCVARVLYKDEWTTQRISIMKVNDWTSTPSEVMVSTPRRFGKTFR
jgi:hypothetical protein